MCWRFAFAAHWLRNSTGASRPYHVTAYRPHDPSKVVVKLSTSTQNLYVMEGDRLLMAAQGNVGKPGAPTPTGHFTIYNKIKTERRAASLTPAIRWPTGASSSPPMDSTKALSIPTRTRMAASGFIAKRQPGSSRWTRIGTPVDIATSLPEDSKYGNQFAGSIKAATQIRRGRK